MTTNPFGDRDVRQLRDIIGDNRGYDGIQHTRKQPQVPPQARAHSTTSIAAYYVGHNTWVVTMGIPENTRRQQWFLDSILFTNVTGILFFFFF